MNTLKQLFLTTAMVIGLSFAVSAQKDDQKKPPKNPPVIDPGKKPPRGNPPPRGNEGPKKPNTSILISTVSGPENS